MKRGDFIKTVAMGTASILASPYLNLKPLTSYKLGYQLYSIRDRMAIDPVMTLGQLKAAGYQDVEVHGYRVDEDKIYGFEPTEFKLILDDVGLTASSGHYGFASHLYAIDSEFMAYVDQCIIAAKTLNARYLTWPWLDENQRKLDDYKLLAKRLNQIGERAVASGLRFAYHNHGFEFDEHNGTSGYQIILDDTDASLVKLQLDMYWLRHATKYTPKQMVDLNPGRIGMWHIKDMDKLTRDFTELGNGSIDYVNELPHPDKSGLDYFYIEQDGNYAVDSLTSAIESARYFNDYLRHKL